MSLTLRPVGTGDAALLFEWVNSPDSLAHKRQTRVPIIWQNHQAWLARLLANDAAGLWIIESQGQPVGQVRLAPDVWGRRMVDIFVQPAARRGGVAQAAIGQALAEAARLWPGEPVYAEVLSGNTPSHGLFQGSGFALERSEADHALYVFQL